MTRLVLASNNPGKLREFRRLLEPLGFTLVAQGDLGIPEAEEPHPTFVENALAKARHASQLSGLPALADDSGLEVDCDVGCALLGDATIDRNNGHAVTEKGFNGAGVELGGH